MKNFAITGVAGYIAPRHLQAIKDTGNNLVAALDKNDSVGILDRYFPSTSFFTEFERFERYLYMLHKKAENERVNYVSICTPNFLHDSHIRLALRIGADAICEKPLVLNPWNLDALQEMEEETGKRVYNILQLRLHDSVIALKNKLDLQPKPNNTKHKVKLTYITSRGLWYDFSWKGDIAKSGGIGTNIGIHFFDMLIFLFGKVKSHSLEISENRKMKGTLELENADVEWFLSIDINDIPVKEKTEGKRTFRSILIDGEEFEFSEGFTDLHTKVYLNVLNGTGFGIEDVRPSIELAHRLRGKNTH
ncbi:MAG: Gfo/Idh/MocA family oxidoreductase [Melioribacteraceae bacterium]|nr:Gfo/Idh/MocA family oxidoreductase [Melioribacteraceae bacterium]